MFEPTQAVRDVVLEALDDDHADEHERLTRVEVLLGKIGFTRTDQAAAIVAQVAMPNVGIEYDVYHAQMAEGNLVNTLKRHLASIWHIQIADVPTRQEPGTGEIQFDFLLDQIMTMDYRGWVGCDYHPSAPGIDHFGWMASRRDHLST